jgi:hypothetical protein
MRFLRPKHANYGSNCNLDVLKHYNLRASADLTIYYELIKVLSNIMFLFVWGDWRMNGDNISRRDVFGHYHSPKDPNLES